MSGLVAFAAVPRLDGSAADGVHLLWAPPRETGYSIDGWDIQRRAASGRPKIECYGLSPAEMHILHDALRLHTALADFAMRQGTELVPLAPPGPGAAPPRSAAVYEITLPTGHRYVQLRAELVETLAIAMRDGKAIAVQSSAIAGSAQTVTFEDLDVDRVVLYCRSEAKSLTLCLDIAPTPAQDEQLWANAPFIAKGVQLPIRALDTALTSQQQEDAAASSRLLSSEQFDAARFHTVSELMNQAAADANDQPPVCTSTALRDQLGDPFIDVSTWFYGLSLLIEPGWRRMLGFGLLDPAKQLEAGHSYDYRITGRFRRRDIEEPLHGFHLVPRGTTLPATFAFGSISLLTPAPTTVTQLPEPADDALSATGRKGIALTGTPCLTLSFATPVTRVSLEFASGSELSWTAATTEFITSLAHQSFSGSASGRHVVIETAAPVDTLELSGAGFLYGVREPAPAPSGNPDDVVTQSTTLYGVRFTQTPAPDAPAFLDTDVLQEPSVPIDPATGPAPPPAPVGFTLSWLAPPPQTGGATAWPPDLPAQPPTDVLGYRLERRRVDTAGTYEPIGGVGTDTLVLGSHADVRDTAALGPGVDLNAVFPDASVAATPLSPLLTLEDVLISADHTGPPLGSTHQYRIVSVDAIGRVSPTPCEGPVVRLEKHQPPPQPVAPPAPPGGLPATGVVARVLQPTDPDLGPEDRALLGTSTNAIVLEWGWTDIERAADPQAQEFRVYWQPLPPDIVTGEVTGPAVAAGSLLQTPATLDRPLAADAMQGRYLTLGDYPFKVASHTAGQSIILLVEPSVLDPSQRPAPSTFDFRPVLTGAEQRPPAWAERTAVVELTDAHSYQYVFRDRLVLDAEHPTARVWVGVSCADDQTYVADALPAAVTNGGRGGNESAIAATAATARHLGRPQFSVPPPLADVPEFVTDEPAGDSVSVTIDLPTLLPALTIPAGHRVQVERLGLDRIVACMGARDDGSIGVTFPDGTTTSYVEANPSDQAALLAQVRTGTPARVEGRFLVDFLIRFATQVEPLWAATTATPIEFGRVPDALPHKAERYVHQLRLADQAGHLSAASAIVPQIVRVPSLRSPAPPRLTVPSSDTDSLALEARVLDAFDLASVVLFTEVTSAGASDNGNLRASAQLLRLPNRRDLYPLNGLRLRLADGTVLAPAQAIAAASGTLEEPDLAMTATLTPGYRRRVALWAAALTRDGIPSRLAGPLVALTGEPPLVVPNLIISTAGEITTAQWTPPSVQALVSVERSPDAGATWTQASPWFDTGVTSYTLPVDPGPVSYRLSLRASRGRSAVGGAVQG